jgi:hypothetical protein
MVRLLASSREEGKYLSFPRNLKYISCSESLNVIRVVENPKRERIRKQIEEKIKKARENAVSVDPLVFKLSFEWNEIFLQVVNMKYIDSRKRPISRRFNEYLSRIISKAYATNSNILVNWEMFERLTRKEFKLLKQEKRDQLFRSAIFNLEEQQQAEIIPTAIALSLE